MVKVNGDEKAFDDLNVTAMLEQLSLNKNRIVVEINKQILSKEDYDSYILNDMDVVEIVNFVGGG